MGTMVMSVSPGNGKVANRDCLVPWGRVLQRCNTVHSCLSVPCDLHCATEGASGAATGQRPGSAEYKHDGPFGSVQAAYATSECAPDQ